LVFAVLGKEPRVLYTPSPISVCLLGGFLRQAGLDFEFLLPLFCGMLGLQVDAWGHFLMKENISALL
jgi:hypothetical protein